MPKRTVATLWMLLLGLAAAATAGVLQASAQPDSIGFISIDCGLPGTASYVDDVTKLLYVPDGAFTDAGSNHNISAEYITPTLSKRYYNVRSFPDGARSCYTLRSLVAGLKYIVRAAFMYCNYDGLARLPVFDLYLGVNFWGTVNVSSANGVVILEAIVAVPGDFVQVCLLNTGSGTPFISVLDLRPLKSTLYPQVNATRGLVLLDRWNFGPTDATDLVRYPDDPHDRVWYPWVDASAWSVISTTDKVLTIGEEDLFEAPSKVLQTAITPRNASDNIEFSWSREAQPKDPSAPGYIAIMHFSELQVVPDNALREFYVYLNGELWYPVGITPFYLSANFAYDMDPLPDSAQYNVSINATANSTLPPFINAVEIFSVISTDNVGTDSKDASAMMEIKMKYLVQKNWMGDPCVPKTLAWDGLTCSSTSPPQITAVNMSFSGLDGNISSYFADLEAVQYLDLSHNNLSGPIPDVLSQLASLTVLDLTNNQLSGSIPPGLLKRIQDGSLNLRYENNSNLCTNAESCRTTKGKSKVAVYITVPVVLVAVMGLLATLFLCFLRRKKQGSTTNTVKPENETPTNHVPQGDVHAQSSLQLENRRFTYSEIEVITDKFKRVLGQGGFGKVYSGSLADGTQVAVKVRSQTSNQGVKEFLAEAQILTRIHHKNLVSMIGYCKDGQHMALVYEYMAEGTLQEHIAGNGISGRCLTWMQRLRIALESAQGLEYLHKGCNPPLIHRDVKATNILLNEKLEAKIADFGLSKAFNHDNSTQFTINSLVGTPGYLDPEYYATRNPTTKSDVYSFGVVLLELVAGEPAIVRDPEPTNIIDWARRRLARGNIEGVVDARMRGDHDVNSVWKVAELALRCTVQPSSQRPAMADVVAQLQECLHLEAARSGSGHAAATGSFYTGTSRDPNSGYSAHSGESIVDDERHSSSIAFEMERVGREPRMDTGPAAR
ncbi:hypothetical protein HU200_026692 [Digitaria exilis]|uniref:non-specific serine/threonine protein kinase n=1 Tax=Digitaria exilis TaxID=1010633 RepID=A0A835EU17_9POAL|nr:hypothetical protein HU200_026692 [Digitaria exilis]